MSGQLHRDKECPFSGVTSSGRVWRKVPERDAGSVCLTTQFTRVVLVVRLTSNHHHKDECVDESVDNQHLLPVSSLVVDVHDFVAHLAGHFLLPVVHAFLMAAIFFLR